MKKIIVVGLLLMAGCGGGSGGEETAAPMTNVAAPVATKKTLDASGTWKVTSNTCKNPYNMDRVVIVSSTVDKIQHFTDNLGAEGFFDIESGNFQVCYNGPASNCIDGCTGKVDQNYSLKLFCNDPGTGGYCDVALQKNK